MRRRQQFAVLAVASVLWLGAPKRAPAVVGGAVGNDPFPAIASVLKSPRCQNCHTATDFPRQGDDRRPHWFHVVRGPADQGAPGMACATCHGAANNPTSGVPGAPRWGEAPLAQQWETRNVADLCRQLIDPKRNGGRSLAAIEAHMTADPLVQWAWRPGADAHGRARTTPPVPRDRFHALVHRWIASGARCPR
jgi:mono/diheme cytochrome c family protein